MLHVCHECTCSLGAWVCQPGSADQQIRWCSSRHEPLNLFRFLSLSETQRQKAFRKEKFTWKGFVRKPEVHTEVKRPTQGLKPPRLSFICSWWQASSSSSNYHICKSYVLTHQHWQDRALLVVSNLRPAQGLCSGALPVLIYLRQCFFFACFL